MKRVPAILFLLALLLLGTAACGLIQQDTGSIKVIPKVKPAETVSLNKDSTSEQKDSTKSQDSSLDSKLGTLQSDTEEYAKSIIEKKANEALLLIKAGDMDKLSQLVHPDKGVRFSPYGNVKMESDLVFSNTQLKNIASDDSMRTWGIYDGSGKPIELSFQDYYKKFVYDEDFINAKEVGYNKILGTGNTVNNSFKVYPNSIIVEYHFPGFDPQYQGMDWKSLKLVFEKKSSSWYIVGIIHDQWTI